MNLTKKQQLLEDVAIHALKIEQKHTDFESAHGNADDIICELLKALGFKKVVKEYDKIHKWYA